jgi:hypothetical protein
MSLEPITLRSGEPVPGMLVVRLGTRTLDEDLLRRSITACHYRWGIWGFSVLGTPGASLDELAAIRPVVATRPRIFVAEATSLVMDGFVLLPTLESPHWTVVLADDSGEQLNRVRRHFREPLPNPAYRRITS